MQVYILAIEPSFYKTTALGRKVHNQALGYHALGPSIDYKATQNDKENYNACIVHRRGPGMESKLFRAPIGVPNRTCCSVANCTDFGN